MKKMEDKQKRIWATFVQPVLGACPTCYYSLYGGPNAYADDCMHDEYDGGDPACVDEWWEDGKCIKWKLASWLDVHTDHAKVLELLDSPGAEAASAERDQYVTVRELNCMKCRKPGYCEVTFTYTESGKIKSANVTRIQDGWEYRPFGNVGGTAPYCPECLEEK
jgi:hypothetical protein